jgi:hypothetical protein
MQAWSFLQKGDFPFDPGYAFLGFFNGVEGTPQTRLPAHQSYSFMLQPGAKILELTQTLGVDCLAIGGRSNDATTWYGHKPS